jgi:hypothetical protein
VSTTTTTTTTAAAIKCLQPNKDHCGRSPTVNTLEYLPVLQLSGKLFARKFDEKVKR